MFQLATELELSLQSFKGADVRVQARRFSLTGARFAFVRDLILSDGSRTDGLPVFFEGRLNWFERRIGVFIVGLNEITLTGTASDGLVQYRNGLAVIVRGPAIVELEYPFSVERLPTDLQNYWRDLRLPRAQLELNLDLHLPALPTSEGTSSFV